MTIPLDWKGDYLLQCPLLDEQHQELIQLARELHEQFGLLDTAELAERFAYMEAYSHYHLRLEELVMERVEYPHQGEHRTAHEKFSKQIKRLRRRFDGGDELAADEAAIFLYDWLTDHIRVVDRRFTDYLVGTFADAERKALFEQAYSEVSLY